MTCPLHALTLDLSFAEASQSSHLVSNGMQSVLKGLQIFAAGLRAFGISNGTAARFKCQNIFHHTF